MSSRRVPTDSQDMPVRRPFTWLVILAVGCSLSGLYQVTNEAGTAQAVAPASRASASSAASSVLTNAPQTTVTEVPPAETPAATAPEPSPLVLEAPAATATPSASIDVAPRGSTGLAEVLPAVLGTPAPRGAPAPAKADALFDLMNSARLDAGVAALARDSALDDVANTRAQNLVVNGYFDHYSPDGESAFSELAARGIRYRLAGENLARNNYTDARTVEAAFEGLMASPGHRANILEERFSRVGVATVQSGRMWIYVTVFKD